MYTNIVYLYVHSVCKVLRFDVEVQNVEKITETLEFVCTLWSLFLSKMSLFFMKTLVMIISEHRLVTVSWVKTANVCAMFLANLN
jgi:hypothetical protein